MRSRLLLLVVATAVVAAAISATASCGTTLAVDDDDDGGPSGESGLSEEGSVGDGTTDSAPCGKNVDTDPLNCGACGHECGGAACMNGRCAPEKLAGTFPEPFDPSAHVSIFEASGVLTDGLREGDGGGDDPGRVYAFDPEAPAPVVIRTFIDTPTLTAALRNAGRFWTSNNSRTLDNSNADPMIPLVDGKFIALASNTTGTIVAARIQRTGGHDVRRYDKDAVEQQPGTPITIAAPGPGVGIAFGGDDTILVADAKGVSACIVGGACNPAASPSPPGVLVAGGVARFVYTTSTNELREGSLSVASTAVLLTGLVGARAVAIDEPGAYVLDDQGIRTTRYGAALVLAGSATEKVFDFALTKTWIFYVTAAGFFRVHR